MIYEHSDYRLYLKQELTERTRKNPSYSLRAFARQIGLAPTSLSQVVSGKKNLSIARALNVANNLQLNAKDTDYFLLLVQLQTTKDPVLKEKIMNQISVLNPRGKVSDLSVEYFKLISDWYHFGILMLTELKDFEFTFGNIAKRLNIHKFEAEAAVRRLLELELLEVNPKNPKRYRRTKGPLLVKSEVPNQAVRNFHRQILNRALESVDSQTPQEKLIGSEMIAISDETLPKLNELMEEFFSKAIQLSKNVKKPNHVYHVGVQIFNLSKET